jgi:solute:Na+ symporter, SSS family
MELSALDKVVFVGFIGAVIGIGMLKSRNEKTSEDYFLAGRGLSWWLIGFSLIAANISTEQFVGMSGQAADYVGLAIASYEWMAAVTLVVCAFVFLPKFLQAGIYTIPEFLEYRYNELSRTIMATFTMIIYVGVTIAAVIYSGALVIDTLFHGTVVLGIPINVTTGGWIIGVIATVYVASGGLKACAWADLLQGSALIAGGAIITWLAFKALDDAPMAQLASTVAPETLSGLTDDSSGLTKFFALNEDKLHMVLPQSDKILPWTALMVGLWIPNFYYWGLNQYITQRTLGSKSLAEGQRGVVFAAALKLIIPFIIVFPGLAAYNLFSSDMEEKAKGDEKISAVWAEYEQLSQAATVESFVTFSLDNGSRAKYPEKAAKLAAYNDKVMLAADAAGVPVEEKALLGHKFDTAFALLIGKLTPTGLTGFILAAILGAVVSSLASMLNAASTIFTMDLYHKYANPKASQSKLVVIGRLCVLTFAVIGCLLAPILDDPRFGGIFTYIQEFQGFISPGILAVFVFGLLVKRVPGICGVVGLLLNPVMYGLLKFVMPNLAFLDRMAVSFTCVLAVMGIITLALRSKTPVKVLPTTDAISLESSPGAKKAGIVVIIATLILYAIFW